VSGVTTTYTLDLNAGLTQVLADGTNTYLYGAGRIAQNSTANGKQYFLGDALGSVRQLVSAGGAVQQLVEHSKLPRPVGASSQTPTALWLLARGRFCLQKA
jgi:hypothetical protein